MDFLPLGNTLTALRPITSPALNRLVCEPTCDQRQETAHSCFPPQQKSSEHRSFSGFHVSNHSGIFFVRAKHPADASQECRPHDFIYCKSACQQHLPEPQCPGGLARLTPAVRKLPSKLYETASIGKTGFVFSH